MQTNPIERLRLLADIDRYLTLLKQMGSAPSIGSQTGASVNLPNVFFVDSGNGASTNSGRSPDLALTTLDAAVGKCTASRGDIIIVLPGHAETISTAGAIALDVAGISVIGIGQGADRPTITLDAVAASVTVGAASIHVENLLFLSTAACTIVLDVNDDHFTAVDLEFRRSSGSAPVVWIDITGGAANACDGARIIGCKLSSGTTTGADEFIELGEVADRVEIRKCVVWGDFVNACIHNPTGKILTNLVIADCELTNLQTGDHSIELISACTGNLIRNLYHNDMTQATGSDPGSCFSFECYHDDVIDTSAIVSPAVT